LIHHHSTPLCRAVAPRHSASPTLRKSRHCQYGTSLRGTLPPHHDTLHCRNCALPCLWNTTRHDAPPPRSITPLNLRTALPCQCVAWPYLTLPPHYSTQQSMQCHSSTLPRPGQAPLCQALLCLRLASPCLASAAL